MKICLLRYQCIVCEGYFYSYTVCEIKKFYDKIIGVMNYKVITAHGSFSEEDIFFPGEDSRTPMIYNKPITGERKCGYCRKFIQLTEFMC